MAGLGQAASPDVKAVAWNVALLVLLGALAATSMLATRREGASSPEAAPSGAARSIREDRAEIEGPRDAPAKTDVGARAVAPESDAVDGSKFGGTVIDVATSQPVAGVLVQLVSKVMPKDRVRTDARGRFGFDRDHVGGLWLEVPRQLGWVPVGEPVAVSDELRSGEVEVVLRVECLPTAKLDGRLVYPDGDPIPWCRVELSDAAGVRGAAVSDRAGRFSLPRVEVGNVSLRVRDEPYARPDATGRSSDASSDEIEFELDLPPTVIVRPPPAPALPEGLSVAVRRAERTDWEWTMPRLTGDGRLWTRERTPPQGARASGGPATVLLEHEGWRAECDVEDLSGLIELEPSWRRLGSLEVRARCPLSPTSDYEAEVTLIGCDGELLDWSETSLGELLARPLTLSGLEPGDATLVVESAFCRDLRVPVRISPGEAGRVVLELDCAQPAGFIECQIATRSGAPPPDETSAHVGSPDDDELYLYEALGPAGAGKPPSGELGFASAPSTVHVGPLPDGSYFVRVDASPWRVEPEEPVLARPGAVLRFVVVDDVPLVTVVASAVDARTGETLEDATIQLHTGPRGASTAQPFPGWRACRRTRACTFTPAPRSTASSKAAWNWTVPRSWPATTGDGSSYVSSAAGMRTSARTSRKRSSRSSGPRSSPTASRSGARTGTASPRSCSSARRASWRPVPQAACWSCANGATPPAGASSSSRVVDGLRAGPPDASRRRNRAASRRLGRLASSHARSLPNRVRPASAGRDARTPPPPALAARALIRGIRGPSGLDLDWAEIRIRPRAVAFATAGASLRRMSEQEPLPGERRRPHPGCGTGAEIWIFRHGEVADEFQGLAYGGMDVPLSAQGLRDSEALAERFRASGIRAVVASTLQRARRLGELLAEANGAPLELDPRLVEIDRGRWQGRPMRELMRDSEHEVAAFYADPWRFRGHGGECDADVCARAWPALEEALARHGGPLAIACHYNVARNLIACALGIEPTASFRVRVDLTAAALLRDGPRGWTLQRCNVRTHERRGAG